ncbi:unnamed protein product [Leptosia nina]|uniref:FP protein C-terminal domain-containing protein n=1 Tax=Leptosia nina TaxID=320188 RepID=A0AAV1J1P4_9NEOP
MQEMKSCLKEFVETVAQCMSKTVNLETRVLEAEAKVSALEKENSSIPGLKLHIASLEQQVNNHQSYFLRNEVEIIGLNEHRNENLLHITNIIAQRVGFELKPEDIDWVTRVGSLRSSGIEQRPRPVVLRFTRQVVRDDFLRHTKTRRNTTTTDIELEGPSRILYFNEHLSKLNRQLFREARLLSKEKGFKYCWIKNGKIKIRQDDGKPVRTISSSNDLCLLSRINSNAPDIV